MNFFKNTLKRFAEERSRSNSNYVTYRLQKETSKCITVMAIMLPYLTVIQLQMPLMEKVLKLTAPKIKYKISYKVSSIKYNNQV